MEETKVLTEQEKKKMYNLKYYNKHKEQVLLKMKVKTPCELCGKVLTLANMTRHQESRSCINNCDKKCKRDLIKELSDQVQKLESIILNKE